MLYIKLPASEMWNGEEFIQEKEVTLQLEHSLVALSKWESKWHKPFLSKTEKTNEETIDYIRCMTITQNVNPNTYLRLTENDVKTIKNYIDDPMTATTFSDKKTGRGSHETITSELVYYWMIALNIPFKCEKWHLNRLLTLVRVCEIKNAPPKKRSKRDIMSSNAALNAARKKQMNSRG